jgi:hypothetical protein
MRTLDEQVVWRDNFALRGLQSLHIELE